MKRSEMIKFITTELVYGSLSARVDSSDGMITELAEKDAEAVLRLVEIGMLPPMSEETIKQHNQSTINAMIDSITYDFKWDSEE
jgi:hypothetical protein